MDVSGHFTGGIEIPSFLSVSSFSPQNHISGYTCKKRKTIGISPFISGLLKKMLYFWKFIQISRAFHVAILPLPQPSGQWVGGTALTDLTVSFIGTGCLALTPMYA